MFFSCRLRWHFCSIVILLWAVKSNRSVAAYHIANSSYAQDANAYQLLPKDIADMFLAKPTPAVSVDEKGEWMILMQSAGYPSVEELARPELKLAGLRLNPNNFAPSWQTYFNELTLRNIRCDLGYCNSTSSNFANESPGVVGRIKMYSI